MIQLDDEYEDWITGIMPVPEHSSLRAMLPMLPTLATIPEHFAARLH